MSLVVTSWCSRFWSTTEFSEISVKIHMFVVSAWKRERPLRIYQKLGDADDYFAVHEGELHTHIVNFLIAGE